MMVERMTDTCWYGSCSCERKFVREYMLGKVRRLPSMHYKNPFLSVCKLLWNNTRGGGGIKKNLSYKKIFLFRGWVI